MLRFLVRRLIVALLVAATVMTLAFILTRLSGDLAISIAGPNATQADIEAVRKAYGLDRPLVLQFLDWVGRAVTGDLGESYFFKARVADLIGERMPVTLTLGLTGLVIALLVSLPLGILGAVREAEAKVDSSAVIYNTRPMQEIVANSIAKQRLAMILLSVFSTLALVLSAVGIYGVISYLTGQRTHEIGIRVALGASAKDLLRMVLGEGLRITLIGVGIGLAAALGLTRLITKIIYGVSASDPLTFFGVALLLTVVALVACYIPARRAMRVDPIIALRYE